MNYLNKVKKLRKYLNWAETFEAIFGHQSLFELGVFIPYHVRERSIDLKSKELADLLKRKN